MTPSVQAAPHTETSVDKALQLLDVFTADDRCIGVAELARRAGLPKSTAFRLLTVLESNRLVARHGRQYTLGHHLFELGQRVPHCRPGGLRDTAAPFMEHLFQVSQETVHLAVLDGTDAMYIGKIRGRGRALCPSSIGSRAPAACTGVGKAMLAFSDPALIRQVIGEGLRRRTPFTIVAPRLLGNELGRIRAEGVAYDNEEAKVGVVCVAAPIFDASKNVIASVSITGTPGRFSPQRFAHEVERAALGITRAQAA
ncbi:IclR family transcriptional regulator [Streptomyces sp. NBC_00988]|uniref:IclR family transcriptional regulator n=1 Tax=Streptomyces sp. NBC_00988 TaxID=2903704 RepID=UPI0038700551|nr:IclR family transcriptional regulator [Streptomyces sp. NBC_00988]